MTESQNVYNIYEAKTHLSSLLSRADEGKEVIIAKAGKPKWKIVSLTKEIKSPKRVPGLGKGRIWMAPDAFSPEVDAEIASMFEESEIFPPEKK